MKKRKIRIYKKISWFFVFVQLFYLTGFPYFAKAVTMPLASYTILGTTEDLQNLANQHYEQNLSETDVRDKTTVTRKFDTPQMDVVFSPKAISNGMKVTAEAKTKSFAKGDAGAYFTWYLKHKGCNLDDSPSDEKKNQCDADGDGKITENDWKVEAMKLVVRGNFESTNTNYSGDQNSDSDNDGYEAYFGNEISGGLNGEDSYCYIQDFSSGRIYELAKFEEVVTPSCDPVCISATSDNKSVTCRIPDPNDPNNPPQTFINVQRSACQKPQDSRRPFCEVTDLDIFKTDLSCPAGEKPVCANSGESIFNFTDTDSQICSILNPTGKTDRNCANVTTDATCTFKGGDKTCKHLFPQLDPSRNSTGNGKFTLEEEKFWKTNPNDPKTAKNQNIDEANVVGLGINKFTWEYRTGDKVGVVAEGTFVKETQHADATKMVMWAFSNNVCSKFNDDGNDSVGFYEDSVSKNKILAVQFDLDKCLEENLLDPSGMGNLSVNVTYSPSDNLVNDPSGGDYSMGTVLNLNADISGFSQTENSTVSLNNFYYDWKVEVLGNSAIIPPNNSDSWVDVTTKVKNANQKLRLEGVGLNKLEFPLNLPEDIFIRKNDKVQYIRIKAEVSQLQDGGGGLSGKGTAIIKIGQLNENKTIKMFPVNAENNGKLNLINNDPKKELCNDEKGKYLCYVTENEIVGLMVDKTKIKGPYSWVVDGKQVSCDSNISSQCLDGNIIFFPAKKSDNGENIKVTLTAIDGDTGNSINLERYFQITDPAIAIDSVDYGTLRPKLYGYYKGINGGETADYSDVVYEVAKEGPIKLKALFYPAWKADQSTIEWYINGSLQSDSMNQKEIEIDSNGINEINVDLKVAFNPGLKDQVNNMRKALWKYWQISPIETVEENNESSIRIENNLTGENQLANGNKQWFGAMISSHLAEETMFIIRLFLTTLVIIFVTGIIFAIMPEGYKNREYES